MTTRPDVRLLTFGPPEIRVDGDAVPLPPKLLGLLAYLALGSPRRVARRDSLLALFWPDHDPGRARNALNQAVHQLRRRLRHGLLESRGKEELVLGSGLETDLERFDERLEAGKRRAALEIYRGHFLEGLHVRGAPGFERWLDGVRARARRRMTEEALHLGSELASSGRLDEAEVCLRRAFELVPTDERLARRLMRVLLTAGDRTGTLRLYHRFARRLYGHLGTEPSEETRALARDAGAVAETTGRAPEVVSVPPLARRLAGRLADRADELLDRGTADNAAARELLEQAIRVDPTHLIAHTTYARALGHWVKFFAGPFRELRRGLGAARWALELDGEHPEAHFAHAFVLEVAGALDDSVAAYGTVLELRPEDPEVASRIGWVRCWAGDFAAALRWTERARLGREEDPELLHEKGMILHCLGEHDRGDELYGRSLQRRPHDRWAAATRVYFDLVTGNLKRGRRRAREMMAREPDGFAANVAGDAALASRDFTWALELGEQCYRLDPDSRNAGTLRATRTALGFAHLQEGDTARGWKLLDAAEAATRQALEAGSTYGGLAYDLASIHAARGETERALTWLERSCRAGWMQHELLSVDPILEPLRGEDRFGAVRNAMEREVAKQRERVT